MRTEKAGEIIRLLGQEYPDARVALEHKNPFELLIATILSAQSTDVQINKITKTLFEKYRGPEDFATARIEEIETDIKSSGFYRNKARHIQKTCEILVKEFNSGVPRTMEDLVRLPGVARKTANIVLSRGYGIIGGIPVDTHVKRLSQRLGLTDNSDPDKIERDLMEAVPRGAWFNMSNLLISHGRAVCDARRPRHDSCVLCHLCPSRSI
ncbi:MAG: endonuclease III [Candidatus Hydrothermarchaeaceae archaeon]